MKVLLLAITLIYCSGCETWNKSHFAPDSFNYTVAVNHANFAVDQHWFGLSWSLKEH